MWGYKLVNKIIGNNFCLPHRVCRRRLRDLLLQRCKQNGVRFRAGELTRIGEVDSGAEFVTLTLADMTTVRTRLGSIPG